MNTRILNKPYYVFRPRQLIKRLRLLIGPSPTETVTPWRMPIRFDPRDSVGSSLARQGLFDVTVCEALYRLADPDELAVDVGANIGVMTSLLVRRVGSGGEVVAVEPHPVTFERLAANVAAWRAVSTITLVNKALSERPGTAVLSVAGDPGTATLGSRGGPVVEVSCTTLDELLGGRTVGVMKLDVEGHEESVLRGASHALAARRIRDIVFEEHDPPPTPVTDLLAGAGYTVKKLDSRLLGLILEDPETPAHRVWESPSYLATLDPERALARIGGLGWRSLRGR